EGGPLAPGRPVTLTWDNGEGQRFVQRFSIDEFYMLTVEQTIANTGEGSVAVRPYAFLNRTSSTASVDNWNVHSGPIGLFGNEVNVEWDYNDVDEAGTVTPEGAPEWVGLTDTYWLSALVPEDGARFESGFRALGGGTYRAVLLYVPITLAAGRQAT